MFVKGICFYFCHAGRGVASHQIHPHLKKMLLLECCVVSLINVVEN